MTRAMKVVYLDKLVINGIKIAEEVVSFSLPDENGLWEFLLEDGRRILATGNVFLVGAYTLKESEGTPPPPPENVKRTRGFFV